MGWRETGNHALEPDETWKQGNVEALGPPIGERDERACVFKEASARARQGQAPRRALEELHAEPLLKEIDALHERGRCDEERAGSLLKLPALALAMKAPRSR